LNEGDKAPNFKGLDQNAKEVSLSDFSGKKLILYFYPKDDTPGCTKEACTFRDRYDEFLANDCQVVGISSDSVDSHNQFANKHGFNYLLLADTDKKSENHLMFLEVCLVCCLAELPISLILKEK
jgi:peroxiredoxin Q/BCP